MRISAGIAGVTSAALGVGAGHALAALINPKASPLIGVGGLVVDSAPLPVKEWAVRVFGFADKAVLLVGICAVLLLLAAWAGMVATRSRSRGVGIVAGVGLLGTVATVTHAGSAASDLPYAMVAAVNALPGLTATAVATAVLLIQLKSLPDRLMRNSDPHSEAEPAQREDGVEVRVANPQTWPTAAGLQDPNGRRRFLLTTGGLVAGAAVLGWLGSLRETAREVVRRVLPAPSSPAGALPVGLEAQVKGVTPLVTAVDDFYRIDTALVVPRPDPDNWRLSIGGRVANPFTLTLDDLYAMPLVERDITLTCVSNPVGGDLTGSTRWTGVLVADLIRRAQPEAGTDMVLSESVDGFSASSPLDVLLDGRDAMIALAMDGRPLTPEHGAPARLVTPGLYGYVGATKWLSRLTVTTFEADQAYWTRRGWSERGPVKTAARIDTPSRSVSAGPRPIAGVAWATHRGISRVEVRVDDGPWQEATLGPEVGVDYWRQWYLPWEATPGEHVLVARAYDGAGEVQTAEVADVAPDGATGYPTVRVQVG